MLQNVAAMLGVVEANGQQLGALEQPLNGLDNAASNQNDLTMESSYATLKQAWDQVGLQARQPMAQSFKNITDALVQMNVPTHGINAQELADARREGFAALRHTTSYVPVAYNMPRPPLGSTED